MRVDTAGASNEGVRRHQHNSAKPLSDPMRTRASGPDRGFFHFTE